MISKTSCLWKVSKNHVRLIFGQSRSAQFENIVHVEIHKRVWLNAITLCTWFDKKISNIIQFLENKAMLFSKKNFKHFLPFHKLKHLNKENHFKSWAYTFLANVRRLDILIMSFLENTTMKSWESYNHTDFKKCTRMDDKPTRKKTFDKHKFFWKIGLIHSNVRLFHSTLFLFFHAILFKEI